MNWNQSGMPAALVNRLGERRELAEFRSVLNDAQNQIVHPVDAESMAQELVKSGGRSVDMGRVGPAVQGTAGLTVMSAVAYKIVLMAGDYN